MKDDFDIKDWNMAIAWLMRLDRRLEERDQARVERNVMKWYLILATIISNMHWKIKEEGHEAQEHNMMEQFDKVKNMLESSNVSNLEVSGMNLSKAEIELSDLDMQINDLLHTYNFLGFQKDKRNPHKAFEEIF